MPRLAHSIEASLVLVEDPKNVRAPEGCPEPWFWVRGDDLVGLTEGDPVELWPDRMDSGVVMDEAPAFNNSPLPVFSENVADGIGGIRADGVQFNGARLRDPDFAQEKPMPDGFTVFVVLTEKGPVNIWEGFWAGQTGGGDNGFFNFYVGGPIWQPPLGEVYAEYVQFGSPPGVSVYYGSTRLIEFPVGVCWKVGPRQFDLTLNGTPLPIDPDYDHGPEELPSWDVTPVWRNLELFSFRDEEQTAEVIIFDTVLTPECEAQWWSYLAGRYPSLGVS